MKRYVLITRIVAATALMGNQVFAGTMGVISDYWGESKKVATLTLGPDFVYQGGSHTLTLLPPFQNTYASNEQWKAVGDFGGFLGIEHPLTEYLSVQTGIAGYGNTSLPISGNVWQFALPEYNNFTYSYRVSHGRLLFSNKLLTHWNRYPDLLPYFSLELGAAFNRASGYQETPITALAIPMSPFRSHSKTSFSWAIGIGGDYTVRPHIRVGVGYQFADLGGAKLGTTLAETTTQTLSVAHLWSNQLRFQLSYIA